RVSAEIDTDGATRVEERYDPDGQVLRNETTTEESTITTESAGDAAANPPVGVTSNTPNNGSNSLAKSGGKNSEQTHKNKTNSYELNRTTINSTKNPGGVTRVSAAVFISAKSQPRKPEELDSLRKMVGNALGIKAQDAEEL